ncbi:GyrI-like domain-containing protein [Actinoplanes sp. CA-030573]|uniref:GyrI-like domain-containing protein n=1 Tax=Actinoplanes sp. CA-030573 TaxID=3239898 RepID=UPI003D8BFB80
MAHEVAVAEVEARPTAVVRAATTWAQFGGIWGDLLDQVWACLRAEGVSRGFPNVMLYLDDVPHVEVGVLLTRPVRLSGDVVRSELPAGRVARTVHSGPYSALWSAHEDVVAWCDDRGLRRAGPRWEVYGPHREAPAQPEIEVCHLLAG